MPLEGSALLLGGALLLYFGAEWLVRAAAGLARKMRIPPLVVGLTVVAYGTSAPEVIVGTGAALAGRGEIAFGNAVGSSIANLGLISLLAGIFLRGDRRISRPEGALLVAAYAAFVLVIARRR